jgi:TRAP-type C4-dicarboxylate transport system permease small subunit
MKLLKAGVLKVDKLLFVSAGIVLTLMICLTALDVVLRNFGYPITGSMEIIQYGGAIVFGFSIPYATWHGAQVIVDLVFGKLSRKQKKIFSVLTRVIGIALFLFIAVNFYLYGIDVKRTGELTASFRIPYYPFCFALSFSFLFQSFTIFCDLLTKVRGEGNE